MPIEINELNIRVNLDDSGGNQNGDASASGGGDGGDEQTLIEKVVEQVLNILKERIER
jgi:hypothetical protein